MTMIRPVRHQVGTSDLAALRVGALDTHQLQDLVLPKTDVHYILFETPMSQVLRLLSPALHPCIPGVVAMTFLKCPESPWGSFECALIGVGCRSGIRPRFMITAAFASTPEAVRNLNVCLGYSTRLAQLRTRIYYDRICSVIAENDRTILDVSTLALKTLTGAGGSVVYSPTLSLSMVNDEQRFVQVDWSADFKSVGRGDPTIAVIDGAALSGGKFEPADPICSTLARADLVLHKPAFTLDPVRLPNDGGVSRLQPS
jgi:hypothetical protein